MSSPTHLSLVLLLLFPVARAGVAPAPVTSPVTLPELVQEALLEEGQALLQEGRTRDALARFETWMERYPQDPRGYLGAATALIRLRRSPRATRHLRAAHEIAPENVPVLFNLAACLHNQTLYDEAIVYWRALRDLADVRPELARREDWVRFWGKAAAALDRSPEAIEAFRRLVRLDPKNMTYRGDLANELMQATRFEEAVKELEHIVEARGEEASVRYQLGWAYLRLDRDEDAERELAAAAELDPNLVDAFLRLGTLYSRQQEHHKALASYQAALRANSFSAEALHGLARQFALTGDEDGAADARRNYERVSAIADERTEALRTCLRGLAAAPRDIAAHEAVARFYLEQGDAEGAEPRLLRLLALDPENELAILNLGTILALRGDLESALLEVGKLLERDAQHPQANLRTGRILCGMKRWKDAIPYFETALPGLGKARPEAETMLEVARRQVRTNR